MNTESHLNNSIEQDFIKSHIHAHVMHIKISRLDKKNALTYAMYEQLVIAIHYAVHDSTVSSIVLYGETTVFTAGNDIESLLDINHPNQAAIFEFMQVFSQCPKPIVVAVQGAAIGIGATLLLHADLVYLADTAYLSMPFCSLGVCAEFASSFLLPFLCGTAKASEKLLLGEPISAIEAYHLGIANQILPADQVLNYAISKAEQFNTLSFDAVQTTKRLIRRSKQANIDLAIQQEMQEFKRLLSTQSVKDSLMKFVNTHK